MRHIGYSAIRLVLRTIMSKIHLFLPTTMQKRVSKVKEYLPEETDDAFREQLESRAEKRLSRPRLFSWQATATTGIYEGRDVIIDAGTGCGLLRKTSSLIVDGGHHLA